MLDAENPAETSDAAATATSEDPGTAPGAPANEAPITEAATADIGAAETAGDGVAPAKKAAAKRSAAKKTTAKKASTKKTAAKRTTKKAVAEPGADQALTFPEAAPEPAGSEVPPVDVAAEGAAPEAAEPVETPGAEQAPEQAPAKKAAKKTAKKAAAKRTTKKAAAAEAPEAAQAAKTAAPGEVATGSVPAEGETPAAEGVEEVAEETAEEAAAAEAAAARVAPAATALLFQPPDPTKAVVTRRKRTTKAAQAAEAEGGEAAATAPEAGEGDEGRPPAKKAAKKPAKKAAKAKPEPEAAEAEEPTEAAQAETAGGEGEEEQGGERRRRRRGGRRRRRSGGGDDESGEAAETTEAAGEPAAEEGAKGEGEETEEAGTGTRRRRRRRRSGEGAEGEEPEGTVTRVRKPRNAEDEITALSGSTRLEAKKQRRREGREAGRRRAPIVSEAEFLARRESVDRVMVIRQREDLTQIAVLEDKVLVEHYVSRESQTSLIGNVYLGRVQNVLPSMEAAFIDIGKGRNAVLYAGEVNWDALGAKNGQPRKIEAVLKSGQSILVQVTKDPIGHKGARLTSQISLPGRFLVYVPDGTTSGISRKLPDTERNRLKNLLKEIVPDSAGVIVRTAAEGASEDELTRDVERLTARWEDIESKVKGGNAPQLLYGEPDLTLKVVRDLFTEDFNKLVIAGDDAWDMVEGYVSHVAPDLADRLERYDGGRDVFAEYRIDEQIEKALDRKVWLPSGGSLVIDRTEAMTVVDVNTGKFTGSGGNLEETVTKNNLEAAEEIVRQLRLRDIGGIIVVDFIDMVLESNRDLVLRRLVECLGRDRTRHQVAEVTSLGLVQMTRKRIGTGLLEAFTESCEHCQGRGLILHHEPVEPKKKGEDEPRRGRRGGRGRGREEVASNGGGVPSPKDVAAMAKHDEKAEERPEQPAEQPAEKPVEQAVEKPAEAEPTAAPEGEAPAAAAEGGEPEIKVTTRTRGGRGRGRGRGAKATPEQAETPSGEEGAAAAATEPTEVPAARARSRKPAAEAEPAAEEKPVAEPAAEAGPGAGEEPKGAEEAPAEAAPAEPAAPPAPKIVTSVRRRGARRAAGPPPGTAGAATTAETATGTPASPATGPEESSASDRGVAAATGEPVGEQVSDDPADAEPLATLLDASEVDTDTGAGPAQDGDQGGATAPGLDVTDATVPSVDGSEVDGAPVEAPVTPHVPVKKRGSRRR